MSTGIYPPPSDDVYPVENLAPMDFSEPFVADEIHESCRSENSCSGVTCTLEILSCDSVIFCNPAGVEERLLQCRLSVNCVSRYNEYAERKIYMYCPPGFVVDMSTGKCVITKPSTFQ